MMHSQVDKEEIVDRYVRQQLGPDEQLAFEEHFFSCAECFEKVQAAERFRAGIRQASSFGLLGDESKAASVRDRRAWLTWAFAMTACASVALAAAAGWMYFGQIAGLRDELDRSAARLKAEREERDQERRRTPAEGAEANVALVMLQASRANEKPATTDLPIGARHLVLWIEVGSSRFRSFRLAVTAVDGGEITSLDHLERGPYGALSVSLPADKLPTGTIRITLSGQDPPPTALVGDYQLSIQKR